MSVYDEYEYWEIFKEAERERKKEEAFVDIRKNYQEKIEVLMHKGLSYNESIEKIYSTIYI